MELVNGIPKKYTDLVGTKVEISGFVFNQLIEFVKPMEFDCLDIRYPSIRVMNMDTFEPSWPTFQLLIKKEGMKKAQWSNPFPMPEIKLEEEKL